jgi:hypothetical protein
MSLGQEVAAAGEVFEVEALVLFEAMNGFDVALVSVSRGWDAHVLAAAQSLREIASKPAAVVGLPDQIAQ